MYLMIFRMCIIRFLDLKNLFIYIYIYIYIYIIYRQDYGK